MPTITLTVVSRNNRPEPGSKDFEVSNIIQNSILPVDLQTGFVYFEFEGFTSTTGDYIVSESVAVVQALIAAAITPPPTAGVFGYVAGVSGIETLTGNKRVTKISVTAIGSAGNFVINGGDPITLPSGGPEDVLTAFSMTPDNLLNPTITFNNTDSYFIQYVE